MTGSENQMIGFYLKCKTGLIEYWKFYWTVSIRFEWKGDQLSQNLPAQSEQKKY